MKSAQLVIGIICIGVLIWGFASGEFSENSVIPVAVLMVGIILIAISQRKRRNIRKWWKGHKQAVQDSDLRHPGFSLLSQR
jgi:undecaprenyl pyrophosphate phosphatase UppP